MYYKTNLIKTANKYEIGTIRGLGIPKYGSNLCNLQAFAELTGRVSNPSGKIAERKKCVEECIFDYTILHFKGSSTKTLLRGYYLVFLQVGKEPITTPSSC